MPDTDPRIPNATDALDCGFMTGVYRMFPSFLSWKVGVALWKIREVVGLSHFRPVWDFSPDIEVMGATALPGYFGGFMYADVLSIHRALALSCSLLSEGGDGRQYWVGAETCRWPSG